MRPHKYYLQIRQGYNSRDEKNIVRNMPNEEIIISENVDLPLIELQIDRLKQKSIGRPKSSDYEKYKEIKQEDYNLNLSITLDVFKLLKWGEEAEFYVLDPFNMHWEVLMFTNSKSNRYRVSIDLDADLEHGWLSLNYSLSYTRRNSYRRDARPIKEEIFGY